MKKHFLKILVLTLSMIGMFFIPTFASDISEQIRNTKCITEYPTNTDFDDFEYVTFGEYPTSSLDGSFSPIAWFVLEKQEDKALLISREIVDVVGPEVHNGGTNWDNSNLKKYLNSTFKNKAFKTTDKKYIANNTNIFILSLDELIKYFGLYYEDDEIIVLDSEASSFGITPYALDLFGNIEITYLFRDINKHSLFPYVQYTSNHNYSGGPGGVDALASNKNKVTGFVFKSITERKSSTGPIGIRPAIWVSLSDNGNQNSHNTNNVASQQNNTGKDSNTIAGLPSVQSEYRDDGHFYLNNNMQKSTWVYYVTYYYHVDGAGNIEKSKWIEQRYVGSDGRMYRGRQTPDGKWVGDDGLVVNVSQDLSNSLTIEAAEPDSWYKTQSGLWYYFENDRTTTKKGWFTDARDNQTYYLDPSTGIMAVGWTTINGSEYYFNESHDNVNNWYETGGGFYESYGKKTKAYGSMFRNEKTPDGHQVDANGKKIS